MYMIYFVYNLCFYVGNVYYFKNYANHMKIIDLYYLFRDIRSAGTKLTHFIV